MKLPIQRYISPETLGECWAALHQLHELPVILSGGMDLLHREKLQSLPSQVWLDLSRVAELKGVETRGDKIWIGASTTYSTLLKAPLIKRYATALYLAAKSVRSWQIRNRVTLGGSVAMASAEANVMPALYALDARLICSNGFDERIISLDDFFANHGENTLLERELITGFLLPLQDRDSTFLMEKLHTNRPISKVSVAVSCLIRDGEFRQVRIALGSVSSKIVRATVAEGLMEGQPITHNPLFERAADEARRAARPSSDSHSSARFRKWLVGILTSRAFRQMINNHKTESGEFALDITPPNSDE